MVQEKPARRPLGVRQARWAVAVAGWLIRRGAQPNHISIMSVVVAALGGLCIIASTKTNTAYGIILLVLAAGFIILRGICNMLDGMVAIEGNRASKVGPLYNDVPDRFSDVIIFFCAGYAVQWFDWGRDLGWAVAVLAVLTAYIRLLGGASGTTQDFSGPMAKTLRIYLMSITCLLAAVELAFGSQGKVFFAALVIIGLGCILTIINRLRHIVTELNGK